MEDIYTEVNRNITGTPLLLLECERVSGAVDYWSSHTVTVGDQTFESRVLRHDAFEMRSSGENGVDGIPRLTVTLANTDSRMSQVERAEGWKGAKLTARFVLYDLAHGIPMSAPQTVFKGVANAPDEIAETTLRLTFANRLQLQRTQFPQLRIQRSCPWAFPANEAQRAEAVTERYSRYFPCGYSADQLGGAGNLAEAGPYRSCNHTREDCAARGMFDRDSRGTVTRRFGGFSFVPAPTTVRSHGETATHIAPVQGNESKYNDLVPLVYGTAWYDPPIIFSRNDGNLTTTHVLLSASEVSNVLRVVINGVEVPKAVDGADMTGTGWFRLLTAGAQTGNFDETFGRTVQESTDPYGSLAVLSVVAPNRVHDGRSLPRVQVLLEGSKLPTYDEAGNEDGYRFTNNPSWILLDFLRRTGWAGHEVALGSFAKAAQYCAQHLHTADLHGRSIDVAAYQCNVALRRRHSVAEILKGIRNASGLYLRFAPSGVIEVAVEGSVAVQQATRPDCSNSTQQLNGGWPAYEFGDGTDGFGAILRRPSGEPSVRLWCRPTADTPNRLTVEFQDEFNEYQQDSLTVVDHEDVVLTGQEVSGALSVIGLPNFSQAARVLRRALDKAVRGNTYVDFETGLRGFGVRPGDLITVTYLKEGLHRQPFRVVRVSPQSNYATTSITAQLHSDQWYTQPDQGTLSGYATGGSAVGAQVPRPVGGMTIDGAGVPQLGISEETVLNADGSSSVRLRVEYSAPSRLARELAAPLVSLAADIEGGAGKLAGGLAYYYAVAAVSDVGAEGPLSFVVRAETAAGSCSRITLRDIRLPRGSTGFSVYRGTDPNRLVRIAANQPPAGLYVDDGSSMTGGVPPDPSFDHVNIYWRSEILPECSVAAADGVSLKTDAVSFTAHEHSGRVVRITAGVGTGQERQISDNDERTLRVLRPWAVVPDATSRFTIVESGWHFGVASTASPATIEVPNLEGAVVEVSARAANVHDIEALYELSPVTRWRIGGASADLDVPPRPTFTLTSKGAGMLEVRQIGFPAIENTTTATAATLTVHYFDEISGDSSRQLAADAGDEDSILRLSSVDGLVPGTLLEIGQEICRTIEVNAALCTITAERGVVGSVALPHGLGCPVRELSRTTSVFAFPRDFFGSPARETYSAAVRLPNVRIAGAEMYMSNVRGNGQTQAYAYTAGPVGGIRTFSGGQFSLQVSGPLAIQARAVPPLTIDRDYSVREISIALNKPPKGGDVRVRITRNGMSYCEVAVAAEEAASNTETHDLGPLRAGDQVGLDVLAVPAAAGSFPGRDLTVTMRV